MNVLIVHAHHEPQSFCAAMKDHLGSRLGELGHQVIVSDLYAMKFDPVSNRSNFTTVRNSAYLKQQDEELYAHSHHGFADAIRTEMEKVESCDLLIFNFPVWWFGMPAILKGWVDRVIAMGRMYGAQAGLYENGIGRGKRALVTATTGAPATAYGKWGINPEMATVLRPIQHGIFWFLGFEPLTPFIVHGPAHLSDAERSQKLDELDRYVAQLPEAAPMGFSRLADFPSFAHEDRLQRFMVEVRRRGAPDERYRERLAAEVARVNALQHEGKLLFFAVASLEDPDWRGWLYFRAATAHEVHGLLETLPLYEFLDFRIRQAARV